ncbi:MAG TPA: hypothetical protein DCF33_12245 [Saprospirales bacterium]|nr:hypothetical protein [Saprospirales bacterium]
MFHLQPFYFSSRHWPLLFFSLVVGYCLFYAPYGINETDGGFLTGLAWQVLSGKSLYQEVVYVRPPLPVWLRMMELTWLPDHWAILGERWIFYGKLAAYSAIGASALSKGSARWMLAVFGFVVSAHCYPPMAWHTVDGILFAVIAAWLLIKDAPWTVFLSGVALAACLLCKQSFYPLLPVFLIFAALRPAKPVQNMGVFMAGLLLVAGIVAAIFNASGQLNPFLQMTGGSATWHQALEHGILDYFRITPELSIPGLMLLIPAFYGQYQPKNVKTGWLLWIVWLVALPLSLAGITWLRQEHTVPFAQSRAMFWLGLWYLITPFWRNHHASAWTSRLLSVFRTQRAGWLMMAISWSAAVSWGYNLPILYATPWVWAGINLSDTFIQSTRWRHWKSSLTAGYLLLLLLAFYTGYSFVYRDGKRNQMNENLGRIFPALTGIYSNAETAAMYLELKQLASRHENFAVLPAFPQAHFLTKTHPPLPLDWVVNRETNGNNHIIQQAFWQNQPTLFIQKSFWSKIQTDPELSLTREWLSGSRPLEETTHFMVITAHDER